ncbi:F-box/FBD/LRR-repeat protein At5g53840-like [Vicia villosa]|uniref:F-box/FBD/LRR-repeat protein At5g53840-like n=1 Tax=Vicia villosa TaxID=3911 RepID=UPI00273C4BFB|nr:F-box/FBD/LRR-repeat protein At5g53840-like [Vicia villosa]
MKKRSHSENENKDRLSNLPDSVILHILSFLNTKHVVQSCVLSTRWKHLWKCIPTLILHSSRFTTVKKFASFVSNILTLRDTSSSLHALDLYLHGDIEPQLLTNYACSHNIPRILSCVSSCKALTSLKLSLGIGHFTTTLFPDSLNLPLLTNLDLTNFAFSAEPFSTFTKLNSLALHSCKIRNAKLLKISSEMLVNLTMHNSFDCVKIELSTPILCTFSFIGNLIQEISGSGLSSVKKVNINTNDDPASLGDVSSPLNWLMLLSNVESLTVTSPILQILSLDPDLLVVKLFSLCKLKSLEVELIPLRDGLLQLVKEAMLKKADAKLRRAFKARLKSHPIPDEIVDFLRQNLPSTEVKITTDFSTYFNLKQVVI